MTNIFTNSGLYRIFLAPPSIFLENVVPERSSRKKIPSLQYGCHAAISAT